MEFQFELPLYTLYMHLVLPHAARPLSLVITLLYLVLGPLPSFLRKTGSAPSLQLGGRDDVHVPGGRTGCGAQLGFKVIRFQRSCECLSKLSRKSRPESVWTRDLIVEDGRWI